MVYPSPVAHGEIRAALQLFYFCRGVAWRAQAEARISLRVWHHELPSVRPLVPCINEYPFSRFGILNHVIARPYLAKFSHSFSCLIERLHSLDKMQTTVALHLVDAQRPSNYGRFFFPGHFTVADLRYAKVLAGLLRHRLQLHISRLSVDPPLNIRPANARLIRVPER